jgi:ABC-type bacteriocin/lantibiotic exporter with double-glycine peptidase domain
MLNNIWGFNDILHSLSSLQTKAIDLEKCFKILEIDQENKSQPFTEDKSWPHTGDILADNVQLRYTKNSKLVLRGMNLKIKGGEKVGVVGRTGAGKSTLANAVTRIVELCGGSMKFDDIDISSVNLM